MVTNEVAASSDNKSPLDLKVEKVSTLREEKVLLYMTTNTQFMIAMKDVIDVSLFTSPAAKKIAGWVSSYFQAYNQAPGNDLISIYEDKGLELSTTDSQYIDALLRKISQLYPEVAEGKVNTEYQLDTAIQFFKTSKLQKLVNQMTNDLMVGRADAAEAKVVEYMKVQREEEEMGLDLFRDKDRLLTMGFDPTTALFTPPGAFGEMTGTFRRTDFVMFQARAKGGKTMLLQQVGKWAAIDNNCKVLHISLEMSVAQVKDRYYSSLAAKPLTLYRGDNNIMIPYFSQEDNTIQYYTRTTDVLTSADIQTLSENLHMVSKGGMLVIESRPQYTFSVKDLENLLDKYEEQKGIVFDVVIVDYADLMVAGNPRLEYRHALNDIYINLRSLSQSKNLAVFTVTQSNRAGFAGDSKTTTVAEDIRKLAHVTSAFSISYTSDEKAKKYWRLSPMVARTTFFNEDDAVIVLNSFDLATMVLDSRWVSDVVL